jgi:hypothetical protein
MEVVTQQLGEPWTFYQDLRVAVYYWEIQKGQWIWRISQDGEYPGGIERITRFQYLFLAFDLHGRLQEWTIKSPRTNVTVPQVAAQMLPKTPPHIQ